MSSDCVNKRINRGEDISKRKDACKRAEECMYERAISVALCRLVSEIRSDSDLEVYLS